MSAVTGVVDIAVSTFAAVLAVAAGAVAIREITATRRRPSLRVRRVAAPAAAVVGVAIVLPGAAFLAGLAVVVGPIVVDRARRRRDETRAHRALPELLDAVGRGLRSGASLGQALSDVDVGATLPAGLADRWARTVMLARAAGVRTAAERWSDDASDPIERLAASALVLAASVGGPQARAVDAAATAIRHRVGVDDELRAQAAQARASAAVIVLAPLGFATLAAGTAPHFLAFLFGTLPGVVLLHAGLALDALGWWWMSRLVRRRVR